MSEYILGISCYYHESAAALIKDGKIVAAMEEERFSRIKHDSRFPKDAISFCLAQEGITAQELTNVVFYEKPFLKIERIFWQTIQYFPQTLFFFIAAIKHMCLETLWIKAKISETLCVPSKKILFIPHHLSHAAAAFYTSGFINAAFLTVDGIGEWTTASWGYGKNTSLYPKQELQFPNSLGLFYATFTAFLGFKVNDGEYKVMGMAGYGKPRYVKEIKKMYSQYSDGSFKLDLSYFLFHRSTTRMFSQKFEELFSNANKSDVAASLQKVTENILLNMVKAIKKKTKEKYLVLGGGVFLNSVANALIAKKGGFKDIFVFPASGDNGGAAGAALLAYYQYKKSEKKQTFENTFLGKSYSKQDIERFLQKSNIRYKKMSSEKLTTYIAEKLLENHVVGWFEGRAEFGPRALGHRSILASPIKKSMKDMVNEKIKFREPFRPFAPSVLSEFVSKYFQDCNHNLGQYMLGTFKAKIKTIQQAPAIVHVDNTSRIQAVSINFPGKYRKMLEKFYNMSGLPMVLNTSFNLQGEPIVLSPQDAYDTFLKSGIDTLVLENCIIEK